MCFYFPFSNKIELVDIKFYKRKFKSRIYRGTVAKFFNSDYFRTNKKSIYLKNWVQIQAAKKLDYPKIEKKILSKYRSNEVWSDVQVDI